jgi:hypothetical protein
MSCNSSASNISDSNGRDTTNIGNSPMVKEALQSLGRTETLTYCILRFADVAIKAIVCPSSCVSSMAAESLDSAVCLVLTSCMIHHAARSNSYVENMASSNCPLKPSSCDNYHRAANLSCVLVAYVFTHSPRSRIWNSCRRVILIASRTCLLSVFTAFKAAWKRLPQSSNSPSLLLLEQIWASSLALCSTS